MVTAVEDIIRSGPNRYICEQGILKNLTPFLKEYKQPTIISGYQSFQALKNYTKDIPSHCNIIQHDGYCSNEATEVIAKQTVHADVIIGIGGGVILDTAKEVAEKLDIEVITIPTVAGTCAAATPLSVMYDQNGTFKKVSYHKRSSTLCLIDPTFLIDSPVDYLKSGIGDTLAKWYEAESIIRNASDDQANSLFVQAGLNQAVYLRDVLLESAEQAVKSSETNELTPSYTKVIEAIVVLAGTVGGFAGRYGRISGAHAIHNGLSFISETHAILHGQKVAYGILVQLALENRKQDILSIMNLYHTLGFPTNSAELGMKNNQREAQEIIAMHAIKPEESLRLIGTYSKQDVIDAMTYLDNVKK